MEYRSGFCAVCGAQRKVERPGTNHVLHLLLTIFTCMLWLVVWFLVSVQFGGWRCTFCGSRRVSRVR